MGIWTMIINAFLLSGVGPLGSAAMANPIPVYDLVMAAIAVLLWAAAVGVIASWMRRRERDAARAHIRALLIAPRKATAQRPSEQGRSERPLRLRSWAKPAV
jgi:uncharacterized membrane protein YccC